MSMVAPDSSAGEVSAATACFTLSDWLYMQTASLYTMQCLLRAGILGMPSGPFLYADELMDTLRKKSESGYDEHVMLISSLQT